MGYFGIFTWMKAERWKDTFQFQKPYIHLFLFRIFSISCRNSFPEEVETREADGFMWLIAMSLSQQNCLSACRGNPPTSCHLGLVLYTPWKINMEHTNHIKSPIFLCIFPTVFSHGTWWNLHLLWISRQCWLGLASRSFESAWSTRLGRERLQYLKQSSIRLP